MNATDHPTTTPTDRDDPRYLAPGWVTTHVVNRLIRRLVRMGVGVAGAREVRIVGRTSGQVRVNVVNPLRLGDDRYLVAPRGTTAWVRNLRAAGVGELKLGRTVEPFAAEELADDAKVPVLRAYLDAWAWEVGQFFPGVTADSTDDELLAVAPGFPVFRLAGRAA